MTQPERNSAPGQLLGGKYLLGEELGAGGMGCVYKAENTEIGLKVAIKHLHSQFAGEEQVVARFRQEARLAASLGHDNICEVIDFGKAEDGSPFLVMPRLKGMSLADLLEREQVLPVNRTIDVLCQTLSALEAAHGEHIVHRDLKPDNIFITQVGDRADFVKLLDFGISKIMDQDSVSSLTRTGTILGTPYYMAPEQARGEKQIDQRADIWAVGVIFYEMVCGAKPFNGDSYNEIMFQICGAPFHAPSEINPHVPPPVEQVVLRAMDRSRVSRFQSAADMREALEEARRVLGLPSTPPTVRSDPSGPFLTDAFLPTDRQVTPSGQVRVSRSPYTDQQTPGSFTRRPASGAGIAQPGSKRTIIAIAGIGLLVIIAVVLTLLFTSKSEAPKAPPMQFPVTENKLPPAQKIELTPEPAKPVKPQEPKPSAGDPNVTSPEALAGTPSAPKATPEKTTKPARTTEKKRQAAPSAKKPSKPGKKNTVKGRFNTQIDVSYD